MRSLRFIALLALPGQIAFGQQASSAARGSTLSLDDAIATAHRNNPAFLQIENLLRNSESTVRQAYAALLPSSNAQFSTRYQQGGTQFVQGVALGGSRVLTGLLYGVTSTDVSAYVVACLTLGVVAVTASWMPARRAAAIDPASVMREE